MMFKVLLVFACVSQNATNSCTFWNFCVCVNPNSCRKFYTSVTRLLIRYNAYYGYARLNCAIFARWSSNITRPVPQETWESRIPVGEPESALIECIKQTKIIREEIGCVDRTCLRSCCPDCSNVDLGLAKLDDINSNLVHVYKLCIPNLSPVPPQVNEFRGCCRRNIIDVESELRNNSINVKDVLLEKSGDSACILRCKNNYDSCVSNMNK